MNARHFPARSEASLLWLVIVLTSAISALHLMWVLRGHATDWVSWTISLMIISGAASRLVMDTTWRWSLRFLFAATSIATLIGLFLVVANVRST